jgi:hypothetical protein
VSDITAGYMTVGRLYDDAIIFGSSCSLVPLPPSPHKRAMIVYRPVTEPKKRPKVQPALIACPVVVARKRGRHADQPASPPNAEADASIAAFFAGMGLTWKPADQS